MTVLISDGAQVRALPTSLPWSNNGITTYNGPSGGSVSLWGGRSATYEQIVFSQPWVYAAVRTFYLAIARLPEKTYTGLTGDDRKRVRDHAVAGLLRHPFPGGSAFDRKGELAYNLFSQGNHLELKIRGDGPDAPPTELWPIPWTWVQEVRVGIETLAYRVFPGIGSPYTLLPRDVVHHRLMGGRSPLEPLRRTLGIEDAAMDWTKQTLDNGPSLRGAFSTDNSLQDRTIPRLRAELEELYSGPAGKTLGIFDQGLKFHSISQTAADAGVGETRKASREETAACFGIPAPMIGILDHATYSNITELRRSFYVDTVAPYLTSIEDTEQVQLDPARAGVEARWHLQRVRHGRDPQARPAAGGAVHHAPDLERDDVDERQPQAQAPGPDRRPQGPGEPVQPSARAGQPARPLRGRHRVRGRRRPRGRRHAAPRRTATTQGG